jgi:hypothetical protein
MYGSVCGQGQNASEKKESGALFDAQSGDQSRRAMPAEASGILGVFIAAA